MKELFSNPTKAFRTAVFGLLYSMSKRRMYLMLMDHLQLPLPEEVARWEDDGGKLWRE